MSDGSSGNSAQLRPLQRLSRSLKLAPTLTLPRCRVGLRRPVDLPSLSLGDFASLITSDSQMHPAAGILHLLEGVRAAARQQWNVTHPDLSLAVGAAWLGRPGTQAGLDGCSAGCEASWVHLYLHGQRQQSRIVWFGALCSVQVVSLELDFPPNSGALLSAPSPVGGRGLQVSLRLNGAPSGGWRAARCRP